MYSYIRGQIIVKTPDYLIVEAGGIGYEVQIHPGMVNALPAVGETAKIPVELSVREDQMTLFGFPGEEEKICSGCRRCRELVLKLSHHTDFSGCFRPGVLNDDVNVLTTIKAAKRSSALDLGTKR